MKMLATPSRLGRNEGTNYAVLEVYIQFDVNNEFCIFCHAVATLIVITPTPYSR